MDLERLLTGIPDQTLRDQFRTFISSGEATDEFLDLLDENPEYQKVVDTAFEAQASKFEQFAAQLREVEPITMPRTQRPDSLSSELARNVSEAARLPREDLEVLAQRTASAVPPNQRESATSVFSKLSQALGA